MRDLSTMSELPSGLICLITPVLSRPKGELGVCRWSGHLVRVKIKCKH